MAPKEYPASPGGVTLMKFKMMLASAMLLFAGCVGVPEGLTPVSSFEADRYLGRWYEVARLDHSFERGLTHVTAEYSLRKDGGLRVLNRGYAPGKGAWKQAEGRAYFVQGRNRGHLKVSFFGPFYGAYVVFELDPAYQVALVAGPNRSYLWLLSRTPTIPPEREREALAKAKALGFATENLIRVDQSSKPQP